MKSVWPPKLTPFLEVLESDCDQLLNLTSTASGLLLLGEKQLLLATRYVQNYGYGDIQIVFHQHQYHKIDHHLSSSLKPKGRQSDI